MAGGGTGGHVIPNLAVIEELKKHLSAELLYIGSNDGMDRRMVENSGVQFFGIPTAKLRRYFSLQNFLDFFRFPMSIWQARKIIKEWKPDVVFATGGFVSVPVILAANIFKVPVILYESDTVPGMANRLCFKRADKICLSFEESIARIGAVNSKKIVVTGPALRETIFGGDKMRGYKFTKMNQHRPALLIVGGSQGAEQINKLVALCLDELLKKFQIVHVRGRGKLDISLHRQGYVQYEYLDKELADVYAMCDMVVSRGGANSLAEIAALGKKALIIPLGRHASRGEQIENAKVYARKFGWAMLEGDIGAAGFVQAVEMAYKNGGGGDTGVKNGVREIVKILLKP